MNRWNKNALWDQDWHYATPNVLKGLTISWIQRRRWKWSRISFIIWKIRWISGKDSPADMSAGYLGNIPFELCLTTSNYCLAPSPSLLFFFSEAVPFTWLSKKSQRWVFRETFGFTRELTSLTHSLARVLVCRTSITWLLLPSCFDVWSSTKIRYQLSYL
jgi:hypothetical protein